MKKVLSSTNPAQRINTWYAMCKKYKKLEPAYSTAVTMERLLRNFVVEKVTNLAEIFPEFVSATFADTKL
jgi:hypothetical protein